MDTLAFDYRIPIITAPSGLSPFGNEACPAHQSECAAGALKPEHAVSILNWPLDFNPPIYHSFRKAF
jgi:hypothetical protein